MNFLKKDNEGSIRSNNLSIRWNVSKVSESLIDEQYQFGINSWIFPKLSEIVNRILDRNRKFQRNFVVLNDINQEEK